MAKRFEAHLAAEQAPNATEVDSTSGGDATSGGDTTSGGDRESIGTTIVTLFRHFAVFFLLWKIITSILKALWNHLHEFLPYFAPLIGHVLVHLLSVPLADYIKLGWRIGLGIKPKPQPAELPVKHDLATLRKAI